MNTDGLNTGMLTPAVRVEARLHTRLLGHLCPSVYIRG